MNRYMNYLKSRKGQGTTEYIVILALIIGLLVVFFPTIETAIKDKAGKIAETIRDGKVK